MRLHYACSHTDLIRPVTALGHRTLKPHDRGQGIFDAGDGAPPKQPKGATIAIGDRRRGPNLPRWCWWRAVTSPGHQQAASTQVVLQAACADLGAGRQNLLICARLQLVRECSGRARPLKTASRARSWSAGPGAAAASLRNRAGTAYYGRPGLRSYNLL